MKLGITVLVTLTLIFQVSQAERISREQWDNYRRICFTILRTPPELRERMEGWDYDEDNAEVRCAVRCGGILSGMFDDETGTNMEGTLAQHEGKPGFDEFKSELEQCVAGITPEQYGEDYCKKGFVYFKCSMNAFVKHILKKNQ